MIPIPGGTTTIIAGVMAVAVGAYVLHCEHVKKDRAGIIATLEAQAESQKKENERIARENNAKREKADAETKKLRAANLSLAKRVRDNANASILPPASGGTASPERIAFDRGELDRALSAFAAGAAELAIEGDQARLDLDTARRWAQ